MVFSNTHTSAYLDHSNGNVIITTSTLEDSIAKHLYSTSDKCAALNIGRVMAQRLIDAGITRVHWDIGEKTYHGKVLIYLSIHHDFMYVLYVMHALYVYVCMYA